ncbi:MAG: hypothetical protein R3B07_37535, partial [Polyangiaceae bacterium]
QSTPSSRMRERLPGAPELAQGPEYIEDPSAADYCNAARWALRRRDLRLAVEQVAGAAALAADDPEVRRLLDEVFSASRSPIQLTKPESGEAFFGNLAVYALALAKSGKTDEALQHLLEALRFAPSSAFLVWFKERWSGQPAQHVGLSSVQATRLLNSLCSLLNRGLHPANIDTALHVSQAARARHADPQLALAEAEFLRGLEQPEHALKLLEAQHASWATLVARASLCADLGRNAERKVLLEQAIDLDAQDVTARLDLCAAWLLDGDPKGACEVARAWDLTSSTELRALADYAAWLAEAAPAPELHGDSALIRSLRADIAAYTTWIPDPVDGLAGLVRRFQVQRPTGVAKIRTDNHVAPSFLCITRQLALRCQVLSEAEGSARFGPLWSDTAVEPPPSEVLETVRGVSRLEFDWATWSSAASRAALSLGSSAALAWRAMAHFPLIQPPLGVDLVQTLMGEQLAGCLLTAAAPVPASERISILTELVDATDDWSAAAALAGLYALALAEPSQAAAVRALFVSKLPAADVALPPGARALAVFGCKLFSSDGDPRAFLALRERVRLHHLSFLS